MGTAVSAMHYTGMAAATFFPGPPPDLSHALSISPFGSSGVAIATLIVLVAAMVTTSVDRRTSAEVERINQDLERRVAEQLRQAQEDLARVTRLAAMGEVAAAIAHEVNQPLSAIVTNGNFSLRQLESGNPNPDELRAAITEIVNDGSRASTVISRIRGLMKGPPRRTELDINQIIQDVTIFLRNEFTRNRVFLRTELASDLPRVLGDPVQLQQVLINLVMNATTALARLHVEECFVGHLPTTSGKIRMDSLHRKQ
jgi:C4-dicarboxylate-specific signal transduction histidine kinase